MISDNALLVWAILTMLVILAMWAYGVPDGAWLL